MYFLTNMILQNIFLFYYAINENSIEFRERFMYYVYGLFRYEMPIKELRRSRKYQ